MSKVVKMVGRVCVITIVLTLVVSGAAFARNDDGPGQKYAPEPAPDFSNGECYSPGPAPNSGDGIPDGPGW